MAVLRPKLPVEFHTARVSYEPHTGHWLEMPLNGCH